MRSIAQRRSKSCPKGGVVGPLIVAFQLNALDMQVGGAYTAEVLPFLLHLPHEAETCGSTDRLLDLHKDACPMFVNAVLTHCLRDLFQTGSLGNISWLSTAAEVHRNCASLDQAAEAACLDISPPSPPEDTASGVPKIEHKRRYMKEVSRYRSSLINALNVGPRYGSFRGQPSSTAYLLKSLDRHRQNYLSPYMQALERCDGFRLSALLSKLCFEFLFVTSPHNAPRQRGFKAPNACSHACRDDHKYEHEDQASDDGDASLPPITHRTCWWLANNPLNRQRRILYPGTFDSGSSRLNFRVAKTVLKARDLYALVCDTLARAWSDSEASVSTLIYAIPEGERDEIWWGAKQTTPICNIGLAPVRDRAIRMAQRSVVASKCYRFLGQQTRPLNRHLQLAVRDKCRCPQADYLRTADGSSLESVIRGLALCNVPVAPIYRHPLIPSSRSPPPSSSPPRDPALPLALTTTPPVKPPPDTPILQRLVSPRVLFQWQRCIDLNTHRTRTFLRITDPTKKGSEQFYDFSIPENPKEAQLAHHMFLGDRGDSQDPTLIDRALRLVIQSDLSRNDTGVFDRDASDSSANFTDDEHEQRN